MARGVKTGGRQKGSPNKVTAELKAMVEGALMDAGGQAYLAKQAIENPSAFMSLLGRCLPKDIGLNVTGNLTLTQLIEKALSATEEQRPSVN